jgi:Glycosyl transferase family 2
MDGGPDSLAMTDLSAEAAVPVRPRKVLFSAMKNEAPFVLEWIAYHKAIGFDEIVICSNPSNDGMEEILTALADAGEIRHLRATVPAGAGPQFVASKAFTAEVGYREGDWYLWLDADEFLNVHVGDRTVGALIAAMADRQFALINWRVFGSAGHQTFPGRFIDPAFVRASAVGFKTNLQQKTLFRFEGPVLGFGKIGIHRPRLRRPSGLTVDATVVGNGGAGDPESRRHRNWLDGGDLAGNASVSPEECGWALAQINHYIVRTPEHFALKRQRGRGFAADAAGPANDRHTDTFLAAHDRNEETDGSILHWQDQVTGEIGRLMDIPAVARAKAGSDLMLQALLEQLAPLSARLQASGQAPLAPSEVPPPADLPPPAVTGFQLTFPRKEAGLVRGWYAKASMILEYGSGGSTVLAAELGKKVISVESDKDWATRLSAHLASWAGAVVHHVDIGPTGKWGMPTRPRFHGRFHRYALSVWDRPDLGEPDLVLIDGRFRSACLVAVMLRAMRPTTVLFDDYEDRTHYRGVEKLARKEEIVGRMARFTVTPGAIPPEMMTEVIGWFSDPR